MNWMRITTRSPTVRPSLVGIAHAINATPITNSKYAAPLRVTHSPTSPSPQMTTTAWWRRTPIHRSSASATPRPTESFVKVPPNDRSALVRVVRHVTTTKCWFANGWRQLLPGEWFEGDFGDTLPHAESKIGGTFLWSDDRCVGHEGASRRGDR